MLPNNQALTATHTPANLPYKQTLSTNATRISLFPRLHNKLISISQLCDDGCRVTFTKNIMTVSKNSKPVLIGTRSTSGDGLWDIHIPQQPSTINITNNSNLSSTCTTTSSHLLTKSTPSMNVIIRKATTAKDLALYFHAACFSPTKSTLLKAIKNNHFIGWPGLTSTLIQKHLPLTIPTIKGHLKQERQGLQSTSKSTIEPQFFTNEDMYPSSDHPNIKSNDAIYSISSKDHKAFMDLTGRFPHCSSRGNEYILVAYHYDSNAILGLPLKNR